MSNWINVNNGLPEDGAPILMTEWEQEQHPIVLAGFYRDGKSLSFANASATAASIAR